ncbi:class I SAM-dependent methyltransferase, partial [Paracoccaceae bacterium]|nr:class I SAM-dependent methyltransferase [Paracoccaceae bacterium]
LDVQNCGWENYECKEKMDVVTAFHVFEHLTDPLKAFQKAVSWLKANGLIYIEVPNVANALKLKGFGSLHMAHTIGFGRHSLELLGAYNGMVPVAIFDEFDIGIIFKKGTPRSLDEIKKNSIDEFKKLNLRQVNKQFWLYSTAKLFGKRSKG